jgi:hypothetical protein
MRERAAACLDAVLDQRRAGNLAGMRRYADELRGACADVIRASPDAPDPHHQLGRLERALLNFEEAHRRQTQALSLDPAHVGARYERAVAGHVTAAARFSEELDRLRREAGAAAVALDGRVRSGALPDLEALRERARATPGVVELRRTLEDDLAWLDGRSGELDAARKGFVRGLRAWMAGDAVSAERNLRDATVLEEGTEALAHLTDDAGRFDEAIRIWTEGIDHDAGYLPFLEGRSRSHLHQARAAASAGRDSEPGWRQAVADLRASLLRWPDRPAVEISLAATLTDFGQWLELLGREAAPQTEAAIGVLDAMLARAPDGEALVMRSLCRLQLAAQRREGTDALYQAAIDDVDLAMKAVPAPRDAWARRACAHFNWAQRRRGAGAAADELYRKAIEDYGEALKLDPTDASLWTQRGHARAGYAIARHAAGGDAGDVFDAALEDLDEAVRRAPSSADALERRGQLRSSRAFTIASGQRDAQAEFKAAMADYDEAVQRAPGSTDIRSSRGHTLLTWAQAEWEAGREAASLFLRAIADFDAVLAAAPAFEEASYHRGIALTGLGLVEIAAGNDAGVRRFDEGMAALDAALLRRPELFERRLSRGKARADRAFVELQRGADARAWFSGALEDVDESLRRNDGHAESWLSRAKIRMNLGAIETNAGGDGRGHARLARQDVDEAIRRFGASPAALEVRGLLKLNEAAAGGANPEALYRESLDDLSRALEKNPSMPSSLLGLGTAHYVLGQALKDPEHLDAALKAFDRLLALGLRQGDAYYRRGLVRKEQAEQALAAQRDAVPLLEAAAGDFGASFRFTPLLEVKVDEGVCWHNAARLRTLDARAAYAKALACYEEAVKLVPEARERLAAHIEDARKGAK